MRCEKPAPGRCRFFSTGLQGSLSFFEVGVTSPAFGDGVTVGLLSFGGASPFIEDSYRMYGGMDLFLGYSFTPYDSLIYKLGNLIGGNLTYGLWGYYGIEVFTAEQVAYYLASSWLGSGFGMKTGLRFYL